MIKRVGLNKAYVMKSATNWTGAVFAILGFIGTFVSLSDIISEDVKLIARIAISVGILLGTWLIVAIIASIYVSRKRRFKVLEVSNGYHVYCCMDRKSMARPKESR